MSNRLKPNEQDALPSYDQVRRTICRRRAEKFPPCSSIQELHEILENDEVEDLTKVRGKEMYYGMVKTSRDTGQALIFLNPLVNEVSKIGATLFVDGTFRTTPLGCAQVLNMFREVNGTVSCL